MRAAQAAPQPEAASTKNAEQSATIAKLQSERADLERQQHEMAEKLERERQENERLKQLSETQKQMDAQRAAAEQLLRDEYEKRINSLRLEMSVCSLSLSHSLPSLSLSQIRLA